MKKRILEKSNYLHGANNIGIVIEKLKELFQTTEAALAASQHEPGHKFECQYEKHNIDTDVFASH